MEGLSTSNPSAGAGSLAAGLLVDACRLDLESHDSPQLEVVRDLAEDLQARLAALSQVSDGDTGAADLLVEAALHCADLANLAACNISGLSGAVAPRAAACVHLSTGAARASYLFAEDGAEDLRGAHSDNLLRDIRGARWRTDLASRQVDEFMRNASRG